MRAVQLTPYGDPVADIELVDQPEPAGPASDEVLVRVECVPVNPADLLFLLGQYVVKPSLPCLVGNEGVATVLKVGARVTNVRVGDRVALPLLSFSWRERMVIPAAHLVQLPENADLRQLSMVTVNPATAGHLLDDFRPLARGDWIVQNAANSGVGRNVIALARERGIRTINIVRRPELVDALKATGADVVLVGGEHVAHRAQEATAGAPIGLGPDALSGPATGVIASILSPGATLVTYGAMTLQPMSIAPAHVVFKGLKITGAFIGSPANAAKFPTYTRQAAALIAAGRLTVPIAAVYPLAEVKDAVSHAQRGARS
jgi:NADPH:quinone reductase-like Zn-dependent oxidoreductase